MAVQALVDLPDVYKTIEFVQTGQKGSDFFQMAVF